MKPATEPILPPAHPADQQPAQELSITRPSRVPLGLTSARQFVGPVLAKPGGTRYRNPCHQKGSHGRSDLQSWPGRSHRGRDRD
jgi:hypothetical protein